MNPLLIEFQGQCDLVVGQASQDLKGVKTGRAKPSMVEDVKVEAYNSLMALKELASITAPDPQQILISPWDKSVLEAIEKGITKAGLNLNPIVDGQMIRISVPPLTQEIREDLVKLVKQKLESARAMLRQARGEIKEKIEAQKAQGGISEDEIHRNLDEMQKMTDATMGKLDNLGESKEAELMAV